jgi:hypothetical protein
VSYAELRTRATRAERLLDETRERKYELEILLRSALHELACAKGVKDRQHFVRHWQRDKEVLR